MCALLKHPDTKTPSGKQQLIFAPARAGFRSSKCLTPTLASAVTRFACLPPPIQQASSMEMWFGNTCDPLLVPCCAWQTQVDKITHEHAPHARLSSPALPRPAELKALDLQSAPLLHEYSSGIKLKQALLGVLSVSLLAATVAGSVWAATAFVSLFTGVVKKVGSPACVRRSSARSGPESSANRTHATRCVRTRRAQSVTSSAHPASLSLSLLRAVLVPVRCCAEL